MYSRYSILKTDLKMYLRQQRLRRQARRWLRANDDVAIAAGLMFRLNRLARQTHRTNVKSFIYDLKNCFIYYLYLNGYCALARQQIQVLKCNACHNGINWTGDECYHCGGTGIYRETLLYQFYFQVAGQRYIWHQPASLVWWEVDLENGMPGEWQPAGGEGGGSLDTAQIELYTMTVFEFLRLHRALMQERSRFYGRGERVFYQVELEPPYSLRRIFHDFYKRQRNRLRWWLRQRRKQVQAYRGWPEDEIPF